MKITGTINYEGKEYQFAAIEKGENEGQVIEKLGWDWDYTSSFYANEDHNMADWKKFFNMAGIEMDVNATIAVIEKYATSHNF